MEKISTSQLHILTGMAVACLLLVSIIYGVLTYHDYGTVALWETLLNAGLSLCAAAMAAGYFHLGVCVK
jgi:hypothetical protein